MKMIKSKTVLFITGTFIANTIWDKWARHFKENDYNVITPSWPFKDAPSEVLRNRHPDSEVASIRLTQLEAFFEEKIKALDEKPILIGHSIGGLVAQLLLQKDLACAVVAIHSVPPKGVFSFEFSSFKSIIKSLGFFTSVNDSYMISFQDWQYAITNEMSLNDQKDAYYGFAIPESKLLVRDTFTSAAVIDFNKPHAPLLFIAGGKDNFTTATLNFKNFKKYKDSDSITEYKEFSGSNHLALKQPTWIDEANYIINWLRN